MTFEKPSSLAKITAWRAASASAIVGSATIFCFTPQAAKKTPCSCRARSPRPHKTSSDLRLHSNWFLPYSLVEATKLALDFELLHYSSPPVMYLTSENPPNQKLHSKRAVVDQWRHPHALPYYASTRCVLLQPQKFPVVVGFLLKNFFIWIIWVTLINIFRPH